MSDVSIRELRHDGGAVVDRAARGEPITITRAGQPVAELRAVAPPALSAETLLRRHRALAPVAVDRLRADIDDVLDPAL